jgi:hypothetical protein
MSEGGRAGESSEEAVIASIAKQSSGEEAGEASGKAVIASGAKQSSDEGTGESSVRAGLQVGEGGRAGVLALRDGWRVSFARRLASSPGRLSLRA